MKKITIILIAIMLFIVTGCSNKKEVFKHDYTYKGENEFWIDEYKLNATEAFTEKDGFTDYENNSNKQFTITYKKDLSDLSSVKHLVISYKISGGERVELDMEDETITEKTFKFSGQGGAIPNKEATMTVNINADGKMQTFQLKKVD